MGLLGDRKLVAFYDSLAQSCGAGVSLLRALDILARADEALARELSGQVSAGVSLSEAMRRQPGIFPPWHAEIVRVGEASGRLDSSFRILADLLEERRRFWLELLAPLWYPLGLLHVAPLFTGAGVCVSRGLGAYALHILSFLLPFYMLLAGGWLAWDTFLKGSAARLPVVRNLVRAQFSLFFSRLLGAGLSLERSLEMAAAASGLELPGGVPSGGTVSAALGRLGLFSEEELARLEVAETSGSLDKTLTSLSQAARAVWEARLKTLQTVLPPAIYLVVMLFIAARILGTLGGLFSPLDTLRSL